MKEKIKQFNINIDDIKISYQYIENIKQAIEKMQNDYDIKNIEVVLNKNLIFVFDKIKNVRAVFGCRVSFYNLEKDISFIVREDTKPSYENLEQQLQAYKDKEDKLREYITNKTHFMTENGIQYMCNSDELLQILNEGDK